MRRSSRILGVLAGILMVGALPGMASANTTEAIADTGGMTLTIPGVPVTIGVTLDDYGAISSVDVSDAAFVATKETTHRVRFVRDNGSDPATVVQVKAKGAKVSTTLKSADLGDVLGDQVWSSDIFGTGEMTTVTFNVAEVPGDMPHAQITSVDVASPFPYTLAGPSMESDDDDEDEFESKAKVEFSHDGYRKTLKIEVETEYDDGVARTKLKVELYGKDRREVFGEDAIGTHLWEGLLCDGSAVSVPYEVTAEGITPGDPQVPDGVAADVKASDHGFKVRFTDTTGDRGAFMKAQLEDEDGVLRLRVSSRTTTSCGDDDDHHRKGHDDGDDDDHHKGHDDGDDHRKGHHDGDDDDHDD